MPFPICGNVMTEARQANFAKVIIGLKEANALSLRVLRFGSRRS